MVTIPDNYYTANIIAAAALKSLSNPDEAVRLCEFLSRSDAVVVFEQFGFLTLKE